MQNSVHSTDLIVRFRVESAFLTPADGPSEFVLGFLKTNTPIACMSTPLDANEEPDLDSPLSTSGEAAQDDRQPAGSSRCWKFTVSVHVPPAGRERSCPPDLVKRAEIAISYFLHGGTFGVVSTSGGLAQFDADSLRQSPSAVSVTGYVQLVT